MVNLDRTAYVIYLVIPKMITCYSVLGTLNPTVYLIYSGSRKLPSSDDGHILLHDMRVNGTNAQGRIHGRPSFTSVQYHPTLTNLFVTGDSLGEVVLRDWRIASGSSASSRRGVVQEARLLLSVATRFALLNFLFVVHHRVVQKTSCSSKPCRGWKRTF